MNIKQYDKRPDLLYPFLMVFFAALLFRLPFYKSPFWRVPDTAEYIDVARNLAADKGFIQTLKMNFYDNLPPVSPAFTNRPPIVPLLLSSLLRFDNNLYFIQLCLLCLGALDMAVFYLLLRRMVPPLPALLIGLLAAVSPNLLVNNRMILSEQIYYLLIFTSFLIYYSDWSEKSRSFFTGLFSGLAYLTRPEGILLLVVFLFMSVFKRKRIFFFLLVFILTVSPYLLAKIHAGLNPLASNHAYVWRVKSYLTGLTSFNVSYPAPPAFIYVNSVWILKKIFSNIFSNLIWIADKGYLGFLTPLLLLLPKARLPRLLPILIYPTLNFLALSFTWSMINEPARHLGLVFLLLLPFIAAIFMDIKYRRIWYVLISLTFCLFVALDIHRIYWARNWERFESKWDPSIINSVYSWINSETQPDAVIASARPDMISIFTSRPAIPLPSNLESDNDQKLFLKTFKIDYFVIPVDEFSPVVSNTGKNIVNIDDVEIYANPDNSGSK